MIRQLSLPGINTCELVSSQELQEAWDLLLCKVEIRPLAPGRICYFDNKCWGDDPTQPDFAVSLAQTCTMLGRLYIASQFGDHRSLICMTNGQPSPAIIWTIGNLDHDIKAVINSADRFRNHLSEHLSFWVRLATERKQRGKAYHPPQTEFSYSKPNIQPEDKGPDGLYVEVAPDYKLEIQSVKNSIRNPNSLISSAQFRSKGIATPKKLLDDFWLLYHQSDGLRRMEDLLDRTITPLHPNTTQQLRLGLIKTSSCNAVVIADSRYACDDLFQGYDYVTPEIAKRFATYIGAFNWRNLAAETNKVVKCILQDRGMCDEF
jgi:hypothetical protein